jgi:UDP-N-acetylmuramoyl-tripeptide--D-alanyl-D-alanine ligase
MFGKKETELTIKIDKKVYKTYTQLFGFSAIANLSGAIAAARLLGVNVEEIVKKIPNLLPFDHRYERRQIGKATIVDNTYSSNLVGFEETIKTAKTIKGKKVLITPGIVELGTETKNAHKELGKKLKNVFDEVIFVGKNERTESLFEGIGENQNVKFIADTREEYRKTLDESANKFDWIFLENDVTQNY